MAYSVHSPNSLPNLHPQLSTLSPQTYNNNSLHFLYLLENDLNQWKHQPGRNPVRFLNPKYTYLNRQKAAEAIIEAYQQKSSHLELQQFDIIELPKSILYLHSLKQLMINNQTKISSAIRTIMTTKKGRRLQINVVVQRETTKVVRLPYCTESVSDLSSYPFQFTADRHPPRLIPNLRDKHLRMFNLIQVFELVRNRFNKRTRP